MRPSQPVAFCAIDFRTVRSYHAVPQPFSLLTTLTDSSHRPGAEDRSTAADLASDTSFQLVERAKNGDRDALNRLIARYLPALRRWASGRLPRWARDMADTEDLVQETLVRTFNRIEMFEYQREGALQAYLRQAVMNRIRDEFRRAGRRPGPLALDENAVAPDASPLEEAIGREALERYEAALQRLRAEDREAIIARVELGADYPEMARALGKPSPDAARVAVGRALVRLAKEMSHGE